MSIAEKKPKYLFAMPIILVKGFAISSAYLLPFIHEKYFINYQLELERFPIDYFFIFPKRTNNFPPHFFWRAFYNEYLGYVTLFFVITLMILFRILKSNHLIIKKDIDSFNKFLIGVSFFSLFLLFGPSIFLYETIPFFDHILPVRWLSITAFAVVLLFSYFIHMLEILSVSKLRRYSLLPVIFLMCLLLDYKYISSAHSFDQEELFPAKAVNCLHGFCPRAIDSLAASGYDIIITVGAGMTEETLAVAGDFPALYFIGVQQSPELELLPGNYAALVFHEEQMGFLAGAVAGLVTQSGRAAAVCQVEFIEAVRKACDGFRGGAEYAHAAIEVEVSFRSGPEELLFRDHEWGTETASLSIERGADVVFAIGEGTADAALKAAAREAPWSLGPRPTGT